MSYLTMIYQIILAIPKIMEGIKALLRMAEEAKKESREIENQAIKQEVENAKTDDELQAALDHAAGRFNKL